MRATACRKWPRSAPQPPSRAFGQARSESPYPAATCRFVDLETGLRVLPPGETGELRVRGPHMMTGYRNRPEETAQTIRDGFIYTGDIGHVDEDGFVFITDRKKDVVFVSGFNVFPREVEELIHTHPSVGIAGVVGVPDAHRRRAPGRLRRPSNGRDGRPDRDLAVLRGRAGQLQAPQRGAGG